jgi:SH3-like domain-containing protein
MTMLPSQQAEIIQAYTSQYPDPICFGAGEAVQVLRGDAEFPGWFWCRASSGKEGWVHRSFLAAETGDTTSTQAYSAKELSVSAGARGTVCQSLDGWVLLKLDGGDEGWIPESHLRFIEPRPPGKLPGDNAAPVF